MLDPLGWYEHRISLHVHSRYSDGTGSPREIIDAAQQCGLDVVWLTDHDTRRGVEDPGAGYYGHVLFLVGVEITPSTNHYLALGNVVPVDPEESLQTVIDHVAEQGGVGFIAHPEDAGSAVARLPSYRWTDRGVKGFTGFEIWNHVSDWARRIRTIPSGIWAVWHPFGKMVEAWSGTLALWDEWGQTGRVVAIGGADAHAVRVGRWPLRLVIFRYATSLRGIRTHVFTEEPLSHDWRQAERQLVQALRVGRAIVVNASRGLEVGFRFWADHEKRESLPMGAEVAWSNGWTLMARAPVAVEWEVIADGAVRARYEGTLLEHPADAPGVWRVVLRRGREHGVWIYSNAIYFR